MTPQLSAVRPIDPLAALGSARPLSAVTRAPQPPAEPVLPNPQLRLDAALGLVVLEFRGGGGEPRSIPTKRELDAYRTNGVPEPNASTASAPRQQAASLPDAATPRAGAPTTLDR